jgi:hypothetical protein
MSKVNEIDVQCGDCGHWIPSPIGFGDDKSFDTAKLIGNRVRCPKCGEWTSCNKQNMRVRAADGGFVGHDTQPTKQQSTGPSMKKTQKQKFAKKRIDLDGRHFDHCEFNECKLVYHGQGPVGLSNSKFDHVNWEFADHAARTVQFMRDLYHGGMKDVVEKIIEDIKRA